MVSEEEVIKQYNEALCKFPKLERPTRVNQDWEINGEIDVINARIYHVLGEECTLLNWLDKFAHPYLANHIVRKITKEYASGEFAHGAAGIVQDYEMLFKVKGEHAVCKKLKAICILTKCSRNEACFCGSGKKIKNCFLKNQITHKYMGIPFNQLCEDLAEIKFAYKIH